MRKATYKDWKIIPGKEVNKPMKTYKMVDLHLTQDQTKQIIVALQVERDRVESTVGGKRWAKRINELIAYTRRQLTEAETPTEVDRLINKIAEW